ncbi:MAG TPA: F0F1 ATP synthase subunit delta [Steroidobacteraceae bacterium]|jgi:F-type H+-transporting ATPase subunit delta|nr:F0F1 ATP synthase subunit delta [Steroidobacteraceae bacterium]
MADKTTIARPYAKAAFAEARADSMLGAWSAALHAAAAVMDDRRVHALLGDPHVTPEQLAQLVLDIAGAGLGEHGRNFVRTLAESGRLDFLQQIATLFDAYKDEAEGIADVTVTSAVPLDEKQQQSLTAALARRLKREVRLHCTTDPELLGGAVLHCGDLVIDGSVRGRLMRIANELVA